MRNFTLGTILWSVAVIAACFATYRVDVRLAPLVATIYAGYFLFGLHKLQCSSLLQFIRVGAFTASVGIVCWMVIAFSLDWIVYLQSDSIFDLQATGLFFVACLGFLFAYGILGAVVGSFYGVLAYAIRRIGTVRVSRQTDIG